MSECGRSLCCSQKTSRWCLKRRPGCLWQRERADVRSVKQSTTLHYFSTKTNTQIKVFSSNFHLKLQHFKTILIFTMLRVCRAAVWSSSDSSSAETLIKLLVSPKVHGGFRRREQLWNSPHFPSDVPDEKANYLFRLQGQSRVFSNGDSSS